uniref:Uncharacterized protein n=1 Tax=Glossina palpalis gambiensis TaxID=67801 RepID=A0A1B0BFC8_9MUSC
MTIDEQLLGFDGTDKINEYFVPALDEARREQDLDEPETKIEAYVQRLVENIEEDRTIMDTTG